MSNQLSEQELLRRQKLQDMRELGIDPFPAALFPLSHSSVEAKQKYSENNESEEMKQVTLFCGITRWVRQIAGVCAQR
jgi:lysyl-tRNA synthetase class II